MGGLTALALSRRDLGWVSGWGTVESAVLETSLSTKKKIPLFFEFQELFEQGAVNLPESGEKIISSCWFCLWQF
ncbi:hypothetical protein HG66A1_23070 [Gimesia chilikensis]|uniref:Uncharacterized protein n=1 Tax=Gimesia chilikensis TaxID=2605989 RepID=A0A517PMB4_9PLAN|nr:hypothetical protein HG66A1_23070 [Gimesia chilikensis]